MVTLEPGVTAECAAMALAAHSVVTPPDGLTPGSAVQWEHEAPPLLALFLTSHTAPSSPADVSGARHEGMVTTL